MSLHGKQICVVIPAYNEEKIIGSTIDAILSIPWIDSLLVVDDGSSDMTIEAARIKGARVLPLYENKGKAYAMKAGFEASNADILVYVDADLGVSAREITKLITPLCKDNVDVTIAKFPLVPGRGGLGLVRGLSSWGLYRLTGKRLSSVLSGQRGFKYSILRQDFFAYKGFGIEFGMTVDLLRHGVNIMEIDVTMTHRTTGKDLQGFIHRYHQFADILNVIIKKSLFKARWPLKIHQPEE